MKFETGDKVKYMGKVYEVLRHREDASGILIYQLVDGKLFDKNYPLNVPVSDVTVTAHDNDEE